MVGSHPRRHLRPRVPRRNRQENCRPSREYKVAGALVVRDQESDPQRWHGDDDDDVDRVDGPNPFNGAGLPWRLLVDELCAGAAVRICVSAHCRGGCCLVDCGWEGKAPINHNWMGHPDPAPGRPQPQTSTGAA